MAVLKFFDWRKNRARNYGIGARTRWKGAWHGRGGAFRLYTFFAGKRNCPAHNGNGLFRRRTGGAWFHGRSGGAFCRKRFYKNNGPLYSGVFFVPLALCHHYNDYLERNEKRKMDRAFCSGTAFDRCAALLWDKYGIKTCFTHRKSLDIYVKDGIIQ